MKRNLLGMSEVPSSEMDRIKADHGDEQSCRLVKTCAPILRVQHDEAVCRRCEGTAGVIDGGRSAIAD